MDLTFIELEEYGRVMNKKFADQRKEFEKIERNGRPKKFKDYYADPEFRKKHQDRLNAKVNCPKCDFETSKCNLKRHLKSKNCQSRIDKAMLIHHYLVI